MCHDFVRDKIFFSLIFSFFFSFLLRNATLMIELTFLITHRIFYALIFGVGHTSLLSHLYLARRGKSLKTRGISYFFVAHASVVARRGASRIRVASAGHATSPARYAPVLAKTPVCRALPLTSESPTWQSVFSNARRAITKVRRSYEIVSRSPDPPDTLSLPVETFPRLETEAASDTTNLSAQIPKTARACHARRTAPAARTDQTNAPAASITW